MTRFTRLLALCLLGSCAAAGPSDVVPAGRHTLEFRLVAEGVAPGKTRVTTRGGEILLLEPEAALGAGGVTAVRTEGDAVELTFDAAQSARLKEITSGHLGRQLAILLDGSVVAAPVIEAAIEDGKVWVTGLSAQEAREIASALK